MRTESMSIENFMNSDFEMERRVRNKNRITTFGLTTSILIMPEISYASIIDQNAHMIYDKILLVGKWIIIIKGAMDTINNVVQGDFGTAKKSFLSYLVVYLILNALPWAMGEVDKLFSDLA